MGGGARVTVAGAGALGLGCALALAEAGHRVTVCDPTEPPANASGVAAGMLAPVFEAVLDPAARPHFDLLLAARDLWPALAARTGVHLDRTGAMAAGEAAWLDDLAGRFGALGVRPTELGAATAQGLAPGLAEAFPRTLLTREDWRLDARTALAQLRAAAQAAGVAFRNARVTGRGDADLLVVATGAAASGLAPELAHLAPIKGHILRIAAPDAAGVTVRGEGVYAVPGEGIMTVGATMEPGVADPAVDPKKAGPLQAAAGRLFPSLADGPFELSAGVRAATPDGLPMVGASRVPGVILAVGARRNGWLLAPLVARLVAACVTEGDPGPHAARLDPRRFEEGAA